MFLAPPSPQGCDRIEPVGYDTNTDQIGTSAFFQKMIDDQGYEVIDNVDGQPTLLKGADNSVISFERYACVVERADRAYEGKGALNKFSKSIDDFAKMVESFAKDNGLKTSPFDYDIFCTQSSFDGKEAPSKRFGEGGTLDEYDALHPLTVEIDRRTTSSHFSVGYKDHKHLWRQIKIMTILTPAIYAAFASSPPTYEVTVDGQKTIMSGQKIKQSEQDGKSVSIEKQLLVPRAHIWDLSDPDRTGIDPTIAHMVFEKDSSFEGYIEKIMSKESICLEKGNLTQSFKSHITKKDVHLSDYMKHVSTLWYDVRVDLLRLEVRSAGNAPWKSKALGALMTSILLDDALMKRVELYIDSLDLNAEDLINARGNVAEHGLKTKYGKDVTAQDLLKTITDIACQYPVSSQHAELMQPLKSVLETGMSDSDVLAKMDTELGGDFSPLLDIPYTKIAPLIEMQQNGTLYNYIKKPATVKVATKSKLGFRS